MKDFDMLEEMAVSQPAELAAMNQIMQQKPVGNRVSNNSVRSTPSA